jgi:hypothetical protein
VVPSACRYRNLRASHKNILKWIKRKFIGNFFRVAPSPIGEDPRDAHSLRPIVTNEDLTIESGIKYIWFVFWFTWHFRYLDYIASDGGMVDELERIWKEAVMTWLRYYPGIYLGELRRTMKDLSQKSRCPSIDSNRERPEYKSWVLPSAVAACKIAYVCQSSLSFL